MSNKLSINRRQFLKTSAAASVAAAFPSIVPASALGRGDAVAPSNRIVFGCIGYGWQGSGNTRSLMGRKGVQYVACSDVDSKHNAGFVRKYESVYGNKDCRTYVDYREMLASEKLDAVNIGLPDHWHAIAAIDALKAGCDVHGEKPLTHNLVDGRAICDAVKKYGRVWQTGSWQRSVSNFHQGARLARNGRLGKIHTVEVGLPGGHADFARTRGQEAPSAPPENLDYDMWIGPAPMAPYCPARVHKNWRWIFDYGGGQLMDWVGHHVDIAHWGMGYDNTGPVEIEGTGTRPATGLWDTHTSYFLTARYADGVIMKISNKLKGGAKWIGDRGWIRVNRGHISASNPDILKEKIGPGEVQLYKSNDHMANFVDCIRTRKETITPAETAHRSASVGHLGLIAIKTGRKIKWDPEKEVIIDDPDASRLLSEPKRSPWAII